MGHQVACSIHGIRKNPAYTNFEGCSLFGAGVLFPRQVILHAFGIGNGKKFFTFAIWPPLVTETILISWLRMCLFRGSYCRSSAYSCQEVTHSKSARPSDIQLASNSSVELPARMVLWELYVRQLPGAAHSLTHSSVGQARVGAE